MTLAVNDLSARRALDVDPPGQPMPNARRFADAEFGHPERRLLVHQGGAFYEWDGTCWRMLEDAALRARLYQWFDTKTYMEETKGGLKRKPFAPDSYKVGNLVDALRAVVHLPVATPMPSWLQAISGLTAPAGEFVACANGLVHVPTRRLHAHTPSYYAQHAVPFDFESTPRPPQGWLAFLDQLWPGDQQSVDVLQEMFGYLVAGDTTQQKIFLLVGPKRSGKGTIARILRAMLGDHNVAGPTLAGLGTNFGLSPLIDKPVAIVADARLHTSDTSTVTERLLSISGEDVLTVDRKYREPWTGQIPARIVILSNELPRLADSSGALASRFVALTTTTSFYGRENPNLTAELSVELPGIFNWALDGLERLRTRGRFVQPSASQDAIRELEDLGSPVGAFVRDECAIGPGLAASMERLYETWKDWCIEHGRHPSNAQMFGRDLRAAFPGIRMVRPRAGDGSRYRAYEGIGLLVRGGPQPSPMCSQQSGAASDHAGCAEYIDPVRGPSRTSAGFRRYCPACDGSGCDMCGEFKAADGTEL